MIATLAYAIENPPASLQVFEPPQIKLGGKQTTSQAPASAPA
jgi:hypothetical protein